tara:strand:+ start:311 stop:529 length:219 start_codon:yes stop_codon:yes gene_type:complete
MVRTLKENYLDLTVEEIYSIIDYSESVPWPNNFTIEKKIKFLESIRDYFINKEEYEKCARLQTIITNLETSK